MKRKVYSTPRERKADQLIGFWAFPLVNVPLWLISQMLYSQLPTGVPAADLSSVAQIRTLVSALPWLVNGLVLVLAFLFRPQLVVGYVAFVAIAFIAVIMLGSLFVVACFVSFVSAVVIGPLAIILFFVLMLAGAYSVALVGHSLFREWQSSDADASHKSNGSTV